LSGALLSVGEEILPNNYSLHQNYPNPFNPSTTIRYELPEEAMVNITIYDMMGRQVKTLVNGSQTAGYKSIQWNATNNTGQPVSAGIYLYEIQAGKFRQTKKMVLLK
jgi:flagellar hook assembly protein FlgD